MCTHKCSKENTRFNILVLLPIYRLTFPIVLPVFNHRSESFYAEGRIHWRQLGYASFFFGEEVHKLNPGASRKNILKKIGNKAR